MKLTWFGHSCFRLDTDRSVILIDPFLKGNPTFESSDVTWDKAVSGTTHVALTHGHDDHIGDTVEICKQTGATLFGNFELVTHLGKRGVASVEPMNTGGTVDGPDFQITLVPALHSSSSEGTYLGNPCGLIVRVAGENTLYHLGDTDIFGDMALIQEIYAPQIGIVPIGDRFTMGAATAALACKRFFSFLTIIPCHYGTFPIIDQTADKFAKEMAGQNVVLPGVGQIVEV